ncbi:MAG: TonB family protein [Blastocatellia bacterium]
MSFNKSEALQSAERFIYQGQTSEAIAIYRQLLEADPFDLTTIGALSNLYVKTGRVQDGIEDFSRIADSYLDKGSPIKSAYILKKILELDPSNARAHMRLGEIYQHEGMSDKAYDMFLTAGVVFKKQGDVVESLKANEKALAIKPDDQQATAAIAALQNQSAPAATASSSDNEKPEWKKTGERTHGYDDAVVVQQLSMAELLVGYGKVEQAIAMLKEILVHRSDYIDVRVKLKDIYLRSEMMEEASRECFEIAHIYETRGDKARARDYRVRAERLAQAFKDSGSLAQEAIRKDEPQTSILNNSHEEPKTNILESTIQQAPQKAVSVPAVAVQLKMVVEKTDVAEPGGFNLQVNDTALVLATKDAHSLAVTSDNFSVTTLSILTARPVGKTEAKKQTKRWLYAAVTAFAILALIAVAILKVVPTYESGLDKDYQSLAQVAPLPALPQLPDSAPVEENEPVEQVEVRASDSPATQPTKPARPEDENHPVNAEPAATPQPSSGIVAASEPPKATPASSPSLPVLQSAPGSIDNAAPKGMPNSMPGNASTPSDLPPPPAAAAARKPSATTVRGEPVSRAQPAYPQLAKSTGQSGMVAVEVTISEKGDVVSARALSGPALLRDAAVSAARRWKFKPSTRDGKPVTSMSTISFNFKL